MTDRINREHRSWNMSRIRSKDTVPEKLVRSFLHRRGYRFRLHRRSLPGSPDIVLPKHRAAIFVHGCYWHRHAGCKYAYTPKSRAEFWEEKFRQNVERDKEKQRVLLESGWMVLIVWECEAKSEDKLECALRPLLEP